MNEYERRLLEIRQRPVTKVRINPELEARLAPLHVKTLIYLNRLVRMREKQGVQFDGEKLWHEVELLDQMHRAGELPQFWWQDHEPTCIVRRGDGSA